MDSAPGGRARGAGGHSARGSDTLPAAAISASQPIRSTELSARAPPPGSTAASTRSATPSCGARDGGWPPSSRAGPAPLRATASRERSGTDRLEREAVGQRRRSWRSSTAAIEFHTRSLPADEITTELEIPVTTVPRTLLDLASVLPPERLLNAINEAEQRGLGDPLSLPALIERHRGERGVAILRGGSRRRRLRRHRPRARGALRRLRRGVPSASRPELQAWIRVGTDHFKADCLWRERRVIVELHSARYHSTTPKVTRDAGRDRRLALAGWLVIHVTWAQLHDRRRPMLWSGTCGSRWALRRRE